MKVFSHINEMSDKLNVATRFVIVLLFVSVGYYAFTELIDFWHNYRTMTSESGKSSTSSQGENGQIVIEPYMFIVAPINGDEFKTVYNEDPSPKYLNDMKDMEAESKHAMHVTTTYRTWDTIQTKMRDLDGNLIGIAGHSLNNGETLVFPNGETISIEQLKDVSLQYGHMCIVVTCYSKDLELHESIGINEAIGMWNSAYGVVQKTGGVTVSQFVNQMKQHYNNQQIQQRVAMRIIAITGGSIVYDSLKLTCTISI